MFASERISKIKKILFEYKKVDVSSLSQLLGVSEVTIRKDLEKLESEGLIDRIHGGAVLREGLIDNFYNVDTNPDILDHKKMIGLIASHMIEDNETIFLGAGTTCLQIANNLRDKKNLNVITNNINASTILADMPECHTLLLGGTVKTNNHTHMTCGIDVINALSNYYIDKAFISVGSVSMKRGYTFHDPDMSMIVSACQRVSDEIIIACDSSKFDKSSFSPWGPITMKAKVITDEQVPKDYLDFYFKNGIQVFTTYNLDK